MVETFGHEDLLALCAERRLQASPCVLSSDPALRRYEVLRPAGGHPPTEEPLDASAAVLLRKTCGVKCPRGQSGPRTHFSTATVSYRALPVRDITSVPARAVVFRRARAERTRRRSERRGDSSACRLPAHGSLLVQQQRPSSPAPPAQKCGERFPPRGRTPSFPLRR